MSAGCWLLAAGRWALKAVFDTLKSLARQPAETENTGAPVGFELR